jgi:hypothetical protein
MAMRWRGGWVVVVVCVIHHQQKKQHKGNIRNVTAAIMVIALLMHFFVPSFYLNRSTFLSL